MAVAIRTFHMLLNGGIQIIIGVWQGRMICGQSFSDWLPIVGDAV